MNAIIIKLTDAQATELDAFWDNRPKPTKQCAMIAQPFGREYHSGHATRSDMRCCVCVALIGDRHFDQIQAVLKRAKKQDARRKAVQS